jgi:hypothetical protein
MKLWLLRYGRWIGLLMIIVLGGAYQLFRRPNYPSMVQEIILKTHGQNWPMAALTISGANFNYFLIKNKNLDGNLSLNNGKPLKLLTMVGGYYVAQGDPSKKYSYYYGPLNLKDKLNFITLNANGTCHQFQDHLKSVIYGKNLGLITLVTYQNKIAGFIGYNPHCQKKKLITMKNFFYKMNKMSPSTKGLDLLILSKDLRVKTTGANPINGQLIKINDQEVNKIQDINIDKEHQVMATIKTSNGVQKVKVDVIDNFLNIQEESSSHWIHKSINCSYYYYHPLNSIIKIQNNQLFFFTLPKKIYKKIKSSGPLKILSINGNSMATIEDFLKQLDLNAVDIQLKNGNQLINSRWERDKDFFYFKMTNLEWNENISVEKNNKPIEKTKVIKKKSKINKKTI